MKVKNIIVVCDFANITGGAERVAVTSAVSLAETDSNVVMFTGKGSVCDELKNSNVHVICLNQEEAIKDSNRLRGIIRGIYNRSARQEMEKLLKEYDPKDTVIHMHGWSKVLSSSIFIPIKRMGFKVLVTMHDYFLQCPNGCCYDFQKKEICEREALSIDCVTCNCDKRSYIYKLYRIIRQIGMHKLVKGTDLYVAFISKFNENVSEKRIPFRYKKMVITNPINVELRSIVPASKNKKYLYIGRVSYEKGIDFFCEGITKAGVSGLGIGSGDRLDDLKKKYPMIEFVGWKQQAEMKEYILQARALVFPSVWYEGAPLTIPEVMGGYCLPCIVSDCSAGKDYIQHEYNGLIYSGKKVNALYKAICSMESDALVTKLQSNIEKDFNREKYSSEHHVIKLMECYERMLSEE